MDAPNRIRNEMSFTPVIPDNAPFSPEQRAWLNGFLAGLLSRAPVTGTALAPDAAPAKPVQPLTILFGSQTGNAEALARRMARAAGSRGFAPTIFDMGHYNCAHLSKETNLLVVTSTYGDGDPPDNARAFWEHLRGDHAGVLSRLRFSVCALGDTNYPKFCQFGKELDGRLSKLKAQCVFPRVDCDVDYEGTFARWLDAALAAFDGNGGAATEAPSPLTRQRTPEAPAASVSRQVDSRNHPFLARLITNRVLNREGSTKETRHFEVSLEGSGLDYEAGDALGVVPTHCPALADEIIQALECDPETPVPGAKGGEVSFRTALLQHYDATRIQKALLDWFADRTGDVRLQQITATSANGELAEFLWGREVIDLLVAYPQVKLPPADFVAMLRKLQPRLYSISSSPKAHPGFAHLTVSIVRFHSHGRARKGVCSTFLADRVGPDAPVPVFVQPNHHFRLPADGSRPAIMVGPGTGIAPFRAFLHERKVVGATGKNWLFYGDRREEVDFLYRDELELLKGEGVLTRLDTAFSRDEARKVYVQHRMLENAKELFAWLESGAHFYVCGDANRMARDVDAALHQVIERGGGYTTEQAAEYVGRLKADKRYQRDVY